MLKATHLSLRRDACSWDVGWGWFLRFSGDSDSWAELKDELKSWGWERARWIPVYEWDDGKRGAWWIDFDELYTTGLMSQLPNLLEAATILCEADEVEDVTQCIWRRVYWYMSRPYQKKQEPPKWQPPPRSSIPAWLQSDYQVLELPEKATLQDVKSSYRRLSKIRHPDAGGTHDAFIVLHKAYERVFSWVEAKERIAV